jgi:hypothetical protein
MIALILALAAEPVCPEGNSIPEVVQIIEDGGGTFLDLVNVNGDGFNQLLVADYGGAIMVGRFLMGCAVEGPLALGRSVVPVGA